MLASTNCELCVVLVRDPEHPPLGDSLLEVVAELLVERRHLRRRLGAQPLGESLVKRRAVLPSHAPIGGELDQDVLERQLGTSGATRTDQPLPLERTEMPIDEGTRLLGDEDGQRVNCE